MRDNLDRNHEKVRRILRTMTFIFQIAAVPLFSKVKGDFLGDTFMLVGGVFAVLLLLHSKSLKETAKNVFFITLPIPLFLFLLVFSIIFLELILSGPNLKAIDHLGTSLMIFGLVFGMVILVIWPLILLTFGIKIGIFAFNRRKQNLL